MKIVGKHWNSILRRDATFVIIIAFLFVFFNFHEYIFLRPCGQHQWRQCDSGSIALNYHQFDNGLFTPELHQQFEKNGRAVGEFPIINYCVSLLYDVFGFHEYLFRSLNYLIFIFGGYALYRIVYDLFDDVIIAAFSTVIYCSSPMVNFYSLTFLPDGPALGITFLNLFYLYQYFFKKRFAAIYGMVLTGVLIATIKPTFLIVSFAAFIAGGIFYFTRSTSSKVDVHKKFKTRFLSWMSLIPISAVGWVAYAIYYKNKNENFYFLHELRPLWLVDEEKFNFIISRLVSKWGWWPDLLPEIFTYSLIFLLISTLFWKNRWVSLWIWLSVLGGFCHVMLFGRQLDHHDYYLMALMPVVIVLIFGSLYFLKNGNRTWTKWATYVVIVVASFYSMRYNEIRLVERYENYQWDDKFNTCFDLEPVLQDLGITLDDYVYMYNDGSLSIGLYLINRKGWSSNRFSIETIEEAIERGVQYMIIVNELNKKKELPIDLDFELMKTVDNIDIYRLQIGG